jgi:hypothetical protein
MDNNEKESRWDYLGKKPEPEKKPKAVEQTGSVDPSEPTGVQYDISEQVSVEAETERQIPGGEGSHSTIFSGISSVAQWFQGNSVRTYLAFVFIWCFSLGLIMSAFGGAGGAETTIVKTVTYATSLGIGGLLYMFMLSVGFIARLDEKWRQAIAEDRLPWWIALIRLFIVVLPYYFCGWVPQKACDLCYRRLSIGTQARPWAIGIVIILVVILSGILCTVLLGFLFKPSRQPIIRPAVNNTQRPLRTVIPPTTAEEQPSSRRATTAKPQLDREALSRSIQQAQTQDQSQTTLNKTVPENVRPVPESPKPNERTVLYFKPMGDTEEIEALRLLKAAAPSRGTGRLPVTAFNSMVGNCRQIIKRWPDSRYAYIAKQVLSAIPERYKQMYNVNKNEVDISIYTQPRPGTQPFGSVDRTISQSKTTAEVKKLKERVRIQNLKTDKNTYMEGEGISITYDVVNQSDIKLDIPLNTQSSTPMRLVGILQAWIEPLDDSAKATDFGRAAKRGTRYAAGGSVFPVGKNYLDPREQIHRTYSFRLDLKPGHYRYCLEMKAIDDGSLMNEVMVEFVVVENAR